MSAATDPQGGIAFRRAGIDDLPAMLAMLAEDVLGAVREDLGGAARARYEAAFRHIQAQQGNAILLAIGGDEIVGMLQLTFIPGLSHQGAMRAQIESVRVKGNARGRGIGRRLFGEAITLAREAGCAVVQLTTDRRRDDALRFYESLGFTATHWGMKFAL